MSPLEKLNAVAARLVSEADACRDRQMSVRLKENAAAIRGAVASIRNAIDPPPLKGSKRVRERLIVGDEGRP
jgi:hypothetical protein